MMSRDTTEAPLTASATWQALAAHHARIKDVSLRTLFADDARPRRALHRRGRRA